eukprot:2634907-Pyramimonas_sp.AAC.1
MAQPRSRVPGPGQLLARTTQNLDILEYCEDRRIVAGLGKDELTGKLPLKGRRKPFSIRVVLYDDPDYAPVTRVWVTDPDARYGAQWLKKVPRSTSPGIRPWRWFNMSHAERRKA